VLSVKSQNGCGLSTARSVTVAINCTSGLEEMPSPVVQPAIAYPNPTDGVFVLKYFSANTTDYKFIITDMNGRAVRTESQKANPGMNTRTFDLGNLAQGIYFVKLISTDRTESLKILVE